MGSGCTLLPSNIEDTPEEEPDEEEPDDDRGNFDSTDDKLAAAAEGTSEPNLSDFNLSRGMDRGELDNRLPVEPPRKCPCPCPEKTVAIALLAAVWLGTGHLLVILGMGGGSLLPVESSASSDGTARATPPAVAIDVSEESFLDGVLPMDKTKGPGYAHLKVR